MEDQVSSARVALKYGVLTAVATMIYSTIISVAGMTSNQWVGSLSFIILIVGLVLALKNYKEQNGGFMTFGQGLGLGTLLSAIAGLLSSLFSMFYLQFIDNSALTEGINKVRSDMEARGMDDAQIDQAVAMSQKFMTPGVMFLMGVFGFLLVGFFLSLIISLILRKEKPVFE
ncbi:uncharacterized protein DUF4199 [Dyadobacter jejuensis]|uniref:Uncharacterized protein DUF4199 n=1 Tax=Dyadobacter jejuensis TaxID=1082580 RepID=A0A316BAP8_9BACT|nr:DUF4199 domain-containing protein [Dyadobacter jejuensis]PWJ59617.1 uncharacterized protein DUF4199 [Dyadobacter jejuensis]